MLCAKAAFAKGKGSKGGPEGNGVRGPGAKNNEEATREPAPEITANIAKITYEQTPGFWAANKITDETSHYQATLAHKIVVRKDQQTDCTGCSTANRYPNNGGKVVALADGTLQQDIVLDGGSLFLYRLKDEAVRAQFRVNLERRREVRVFRKVSSGVVELAVGAAVVRVVARVVRAGGVDGVERVRICLDEGSNRLVCREVDKRRLNGHVAR